MKQVTQIFATFMTILLSVGAAYAVDPDMQALVTDTTTSVREPGTGLLLLAGIIGLAIGFRNRK